MYKTKWYGRRYEPLHLMEALSTQAPGSSNLPINLTTPARHEPQR